MLDKNLSNDKGLEVNVAISQKKIKLQQKWQETEWTKILKTDSAVSCLSLAETANWAESGKHKFWSESSEILNLKSSTTPETVAFTPPWYQTWWNP